MKKFLIIVLMILMSGVALGKGKVRSYNIDASDLTFEIYQINALMFGYKNVDRWNQLMVGTIAAETNYGKFRGKSPLGITQISPAGWGYIKSRITQEEKDKLKILGYDHDEIILKDLADDTTLAIAYGAIYYNHKLKGVPPKDINDCAKVWKKYYNTSAGSGTIKGFKNKYAYHGEKHLMAFYNNPIKEFDVHIVVNKLIDNVAA